MSIPSIRSVETLQPPFSTGDRFKRRAATVVKSKYARQRQSGLLRIWSPVVSPTGSSNRRRVRVEEYDGLVAVAGFLEQFRSLSS